MYDFLIDHARLNVYCGLDQDKQFIIEPAKISPIDGVFNLVNVLNKQYTLPLQGKRFHIYQIPG